MSINFNIKINRKIICNGQEYDSFGELPENAKHACEKVISGGGPCVVGPVHYKMKIVFNGCEFGSVDEMSDEMRKGYDAALCISKGSRIVSGTAVPPEVIEAVRACAGQNVGFFRRLFPRTLLQWIEPKAVRGAMYEADKAGMLRLLPVILIVTALCIFILGRIMPGMETGKLYAVLGVVIGMMIFFLIAGKFGSASISITDTGIVMGYGKTASIWPFDQIDHCEITGTAAGGTIYNVLVAQTKGGQRSVIGVASSVSLDRLQLLLESKGVKVVMQKA